jgi:lipopolysaccharide/colanic/teichoic acid biosynthesis glycosyltransferase
VEPFFAPIETERAQRRLAGASTPRSAVSAQPYESGCDVASSIQPSSCEPELNNRRSRHRKPRAINSRADSQALSHLEQTGTGVFWLDIATVHPVAARLKRITDVVLSVVLITLLAPLFLLLVALVKLTSRGPAVFCQERIGFRCNVFEMYKFRTMRVGAHMAEKQLAEMEGGVFLKPKNDPRITSIGRFLRKFSLDELPQLFNVLEGTMSLVGPRPLLVSDLSKFPRRSQMRRFSVRPGITGLWQVSGRSSCTDQERLDLDRRYVDEWSLRLDFRILLKTVGVVIAARDSR